MVPSCTATVVFAPLFAYLILYVRTAYLAQRESKGAPPRGMLWQFRRETYTDLGWKYHMRGRWMFAAFLPLALLLLQVARLFCPDW